MSSRKHHPQLVIEDGEPTAVILDIEEYEAMLEALDDLEDLKALADMRRHPLRLRSLDEFLQEHDAGVRDPA